MMYEKCTLGYLTKRKKAEILWIVFFVVLGVAIFLTGYLWSGVLFSYFYGLIRYNSILAGKIPSH